MKFEIGTVKNESAKIITVSEFTDLGPAERIVLEARHKLLPKEF